MKLMGIWCAGAAVLLTGCQNTVNTIGNADRNMVQNVIRDERVETDVFLRNRMELRNLTAGRTGDGLMHIQLEIFNKRTSVLAQAWSGLAGANPCRIRYKVNWFRADGTAVETRLSDWQDAAILPGETFYLKSVAPAPECQDFRISLRENQ